jgi:hypothetical protein
MSKRQWAGIEDVSKITVNFGPGQPSLLVLISDW